jgi:hypothetical protein
MKTTRRNMIKAVGGMSVLGVLPGIASGCNEQKTTPKKTIHTDVLVVGGGSAGISAAIQSAEAGCSTILVEAGSQLGGTTTTGGVAFPGIFHAWGKQIIGGVGWELSKQTVELNGDKLPDFSQPPMAHWMHQLVINPYLFTMLAEERCLNAGVQLRYYETPVSAIFTGKEWELDIVGKGTNARIIAQQIIDCTGNASITALAGFNVLREETTQPGTIIYKLGGIDLNKIDRKLYNEAYKEAVAKGDFEEHFLYRGLMAELSTASVNQKRSAAANHITGADSSTSETHTIANINGRKGVLNLLKLIKKLPGGENAYIDRLCAETAVRETYRIDGEHIISEEEYVSGKVFDDALAYSFYPIDVHSKKGVKPEHLKEGIVPTIPLRALIPKNSQNFLVAGRCVSSDRGANSALRVQASCMAMGQAAGATAALAAKTGEDIQNLPINSIRTLIREHGGIVPSDNV